MNLSFLSQSIDELDRSLGQAANRAVNTLLTARNWLIGFYIVEYEHEGEDRGSYGENITEELAQRLNSKGLSARNLWLFRQFYLATPQIGLAFVDHPRILQTLSAVFPKKPLITDNQSVKILHPVSAELKPDQKNLLQRILHSPGAEFAKSAQWQRALAELPDLHVSGEKLLQRLSFTHFKALLPIKDHLKRTFYEIETIKGTWSVRELKRQISSLYFERSGLSVDPDRLSQITHTELVPTEPRHLTKNIQYATAGMDENLFVKKYLLQLPTPEELKTFLHQELSRL